MAPRPVKKLAVHEMLRRAAQMSAAIYLAQDCSVTLPQYVILSQLLKNGPMIHRKLTEESGIDRSTMSDTVRRLMDRKLIVRVAHESDLRARLISITPAGINELMPAQRTMAAVELQLLKAVPRPLRAPLLLALQAIATTEYPVRLSVKRRLRPR